MHNDDDAPSAPRRWSPDPVLDFPDRTRKRSDLELEIDPLYRLERNERSTHHAIAYAIMVPVITAALGLALALISRGRGGPICDAGQATWICSRTFEILFPLVPWLFSFGGFIGAAVITYRQWSRCLRWRPWLAIMWVLGPFTMGWGTAFGTLLIVGQH